MSAKTASLPSGLLTADGKRLSFAAYCLLIIVCIAFYAPGFATLPPTDRDESLFAQASKQMIESGNYADIRIQNEHRYKKPIGIYWLQAASVKLLSNGNLNAIWAYRAPSAAGAILAVLMTAALGSLLFGPMAGFLAALMMAGCLVLNIEARQAKTDAALLATIMIAQYGLARAYLNSIRGPVVPFVFWTAIGAGILIKGPIILLIVISTLLWLWVSEKNLRWFRDLRPAAGAIYALFLTLPWLVMVGVASHGAFYQQSAGHDMLGKIANGEMRGMVPPGAHLLIFPLMFFPFSLIAMMAAPDSWAARREPAVRFCLGWIIPAWIVFELALTKLPHYVMPMYPAIAMLSARAFINGFPALARQRWRWQPVLAITVWLLVGTGLALALAILPRHFDGVWNGWSIGGGVALIIAEGAALLFLFEKKAAPGVGALATGALLFFACAFGMTVPYIHNIWLSRQVVEIAEAARPCGKLQIVSATYNEPSLIFTAGTDTQFEASGNLAALDIWRTPCKIALIDSEHAESFMRAFPNKAYQPQVVGRIDGFNLGRGRPITMTLYTLPPKPVTK